MSIDVVLVRARQPGPQAAQALAEAIAARYGVPTAAIAERLKAGSFRVKSGTDRESAFLYASDLESIGGVCELRDAATGRVIAREPTEGEAGLAAADGTFSQDLGALSGGGNLSLATLDGGTGDTEPPPIAGAALAKPNNLAIPPSGTPALSATANGNFEPPPTTDDEPLTLAIDPRGPAPGLAAAQASELAPPPAHHVDDAFASPAAAADAGSELTLAVEPIDVGTSSAPAAPVSRTMAPEIAELPASALVANGTPQARTGRSFGAQFSAALASARGGLASRGRGAFVAGVVTSLLIGFFVAHLVAVVQETSAYSPVRTELQGSYAEATDSESHAALTAIRAGAVDLIESRQRRIAITSLLVWLLAAAGVAALWFRVMPWERLSNSSRPT